MELNVHIKYMRRCLQLASLGNGYVSPNPMVGAVLVYNERIIGEGYHREFGSAHAEVNCLASVKAEDEELIQHSTLYVSLEPCAHFGKTPPCADLIIEKKIAEVVIGCRDPFNEVNGKGIEKLEKAGIRVIQGILEKECKELNKRFFTFHTTNRPFIILKWAQTKDNKIGNEDYSRLKISNDHSNRMVHKWRSREMAIMVGTNTALFDDPQLNTRLWPGNDPVRLILDLHLRLPRNLKIFASGQTAIVFNLHQHTIDAGSLHDQSIKGVIYYQVSEDASIVHQVMNALCQLKINSVLIEGGAQLLQTFIDEGAWDEARVITNEKMIALGGLPAPVLKNGKIFKSRVFLNDVIRSYKNTIHY
jgi:diaminohydroxyphosphoribosylaminopyrimidine deaminase / 5-amino-6-(5-phosphoribosylamino)uracil reductase